MLPDKGADLAGARERQLIPHAHADTLLDLVPTCGLVRLEQPARDIRDGHSRQTLLGAAAPVVFLFDKKPGRGCPHLDGETVRANADIDAAELVVDRDRPPPLIIERAIGVESEALKGFLDRLECAVLAR